MLHRLSFYTKLLLLSTANTNQPFYQHSAIATLRESHSLWRGQNNCKWGDLEKIEIFFELHIKILPSFRYFIGWWLSVTINLS